MKRRFFIKLCAAVLALFVALTSASVFQITRVFADEEVQLDDDGDGDGDAGQEEPIDPDGPFIDPVLPPEEPVDPDPPQPDPFDYDLVCTTPIIDFGTVNQGDIVNPKQFSIVNVGNNYFPLTWDEMDLYTGFDMSFIGETFDMNPGDSAPFSIQPKYNLAPGTYEAMFTFSSANDIRRHHTATATVRIVVLENQPSIERVEISPNSVSLPAGTTYQFDATVYGRGSYDPSVTWSVSGNQSGETGIDGDGNLYISDSETASYFAVIATSRQDPSVSDRASVSVTKNDYVVRVKADPSDGGAVAGGGTVSAGGNCSISASPNRNYSFKGWYEGGNLFSEAAQEVVDNITSDRTFVAKFERKSCYVKTNVNDPNGGKISDGGSVEYGGSMTISAAPKDGYSFVGFFENNERISTDDPMVLSNITSDRTITAVFNREVCFVNVSVRPQDTGKYEGAGKYDIGSNVKLRASAYDGYQFAGWDINGQIVSTDTTYEIKGIQHDVDVVATFMKKEATTYRIGSGVAGEGGTIVPSGDYIVEEGGSVTYNMAAKSGYKISTVIIDGKNAGAISSYTFNNVRGPHNIVVSFEKVQSAAPAAAPKASVAGKTRTPKEAPKVTEYNEKTAAEGALPEPEKSQVEVTGSEEELTGEDYEDDTYTPAVEPADPEAPVATGIMAKHNLDEDTLRQLIRDKAVFPLLKDAYDEGILQITVNNTYNPTPDEITATITNFEEVMTGAMTDEEIYQVISGIPISFNIDITENTATLDKDTMKAIQSKISYKPLSYFDFTILKTSDGTTTMVKELDADLQVTIPIPAQLQKNGRKFFVIRDHNGDVDVLDDIGSDPASVTFRTNKFSEYALAYESINMKKLTIVSSIVAFVSLLTAIASIIVMSLKKKK